MSSEAGTTTVTHAAGVAPGAPLAGLAIAWRFPRGNVPPVVLEWEGDGERVKFSNEQFDGHTLSCPEQVGRNQQNES